MLLTDDELLRDFDGFSNLKTTYSKVENDRFFSLYFWTKNEVHEMFLRCFLPFKFDIVGFKFGKEE